MKRMLAASMLLLMSCSQPVEPAEERRLGTLMYSILADTAYVTVPDTVRAGEVFSIQVVTQGAGCHRTGETEVETTPEEIVVRPFDYVSNHESCDRFLWNGTHRAEASLDEVGVRQVVIVALERASQDTVRVERTITVEP